MIVNNELFELIDDNLLQKLSDEIIDYNLEAYKELS